MGRRIQSFYGMCAGLSGIVVSLGTVFFASLLGVVLPLWCRLLVSASVLISSVFVVYLCLGSAGDMKETTRAILAILTAMGLFLVGIFSAVTTHRIRTVLVDLGSVASPAPSQFFLFLPGWAFILMGCLFGVIVGISIWRIKRAWISIPACVLVAVSLYLYLGLLSGSMLDPFVGVVRESRTTQSEGASLSNQQSPPTNTTSVTTNSSPSPWLLTTEEGTYLDIRQMPVTNTLPAANNTSFPLVQP